MLTSSSSLTFGPFSHCDSKGPLGEGLMPSTRSVRLQNACTYIRGHPVSDRTWMYFWQVNTLRKLTNSYTCQFPKSLLFLQLNPEVNQAMVTHRLLFFPSDTARSNVSKTAKVSLKRSSLYMLSIQGIRNTSTKRHLKSLNAVIKRRKAKL